MTFVFMSAMNEIVHHACTRSTQFSQTLNMLEDYFVQCLKVRVLRTLLQTWQPGGGYLPRAYRFQETQQPLMFISFHLKINGDMYYFYINCFSWQEIVDSRF